MDIVNLSLTGPADPLLGALTARATALGAIVVGAVPGNGRMDGFPAGAPGVIAVVTHDNAPKFPGVVGNHEANDRVVQGLQDSVVPLAGVGHPDQALLGGGQQQRADRAVDGGEEHGRGTGHAGVLGVASRHRWMTA